jgi:hypothetical protein
MARSLRLRQLERRLAELRRFMLPARFESTGSYTDRQFDRARGYRLLAHAEIEACIEDLALSVIQTAYNSWRLDYRPRHSILTLLAYYEDSLGSVPTTISSAGASTTPLRTRVERARNQYIASVRKNHGIREANVLRLLLPIGVMESDLDGAWLQQIDAFGSARGNTAHQGGRAQQPPDPATEYATVSNILAGLRKVDVRLSALAR